MRQVVLKNDESVVVDTELFTVVIRKVFDGSAAYIKMESRPKVGLVVREDSATRVVVDGAL
jgi:hypothetical protein